MTGAKARTRKLPLQKEPAESPASEVAAPLRRTGRGWARVRDALAPAFAEGLVDEMPLH
jgi:hypothetical protein